MVAAILKRELSAAAIDKTFGSFEKFKEEFSAAAACRFRSGWTWLIVDASGNLKVTSTPNQDNPIMDIAEVKGTPIWISMSGNMPIT